MLKCPSPKCEQQFASPKVLGIDLPIGNSPLRGLAYVCPYCNVAISVQVDPIAVMSETVERLMKRLKG